MRKTTFSTLLNLVILGCLFVFGACAAVLPNAKTVKRPTGIITAQTAEFTQTMGFQIGHSIRFEFVAENANGDIPIVVALDSRKNIREILRENTNENYRAKDLVPIIQQTKFSNHNFGGGGFSGINIDTYARAKV